MLAYLGQGAAAPTARDAAPKGIETAIFGGLAVALILFAAWWVHERAA